MNTLLTGRAYTFGDNIDTDIIAPGMTISFGLADGSEMEEVKTHAFEEVRPGFHREVIPGSILVAGKNFGFGSHREQAITIVQYLGFRIILADSVARLYERNAFAIGFPIIEVPGISAMVSEGDIVEVDMESWNVTNKTTGKSVAVEPLSETVLGIIEAGGIIELLKESWEKKQRAAN